VSEKDKNLIFKYNFLRVQFLKYYTERTVLLKNLKI